MFDSFDMYNHKDIEELLGYPTSRGSFPPYDVYAYEDGSAKAVIAVAGYTRDDIMVTVDGSLLDVEGSRVNEEEEDAYCAHRGIARRSFQLRFHFSDKLVPDTIHLKDGLLTIFWAVDKEKAPKEMPIL
jgi:molecular chaperone IbpA